MEEVDDKEVEENGREVHESGDDNKTVMDGETTLETVLAGIDDNKKDGEVSDIHAEVEDEVENVHIVNEGVQDSTAPTEFGDGDAELGGKRGEKSSHCERRHTRVYIFYKIW